MTPSPLCSPSLHLNLTHPHQPSRALSTASPLLTRLAWDVLIPGRAAVESVNSWREGFRGARTGPGGAVMGPWYQDGLPDFTILVLCINAIAEVELEFCLAMLSR